ncbi:reverse transcriptase domain-containing protein [Tanacetum coccineum]
MDHGGGGGFPADEEADHVAAIADHRTYFSEDRQIEIYAYALRLTFASTNNEAEYEALLAGLRIARMMNVLRLEVKVDSKLVASQINGMYEASNGSMIKYLAKARKYISESPNLKNLRALKTNQ